METPYGEIPERFVKDMSAQEMHDYLRQRYSRRSVLKGAAASRQEAQLPRRPVRPGRRGIGVTSFPGS
jgi:hypothetical protein